MILRINAVFYGIGIHDVKDFEVLIVLLLTDFARVAARTNRIQLKSIINPFQAWPALFVIQAGGG